MKSNGVANTPTKIHLVAGTRPNIIKIIPLYQTLLKQSWCEPKFIWFTQHYTPELSRDNFEDFGVKDPDVVLDIPGSGFGHRLGALIASYMCHCEKDRPDFVVVAGDVDTSLGVGLAARRIGVPLVHLEAGLRSYDSTMPEETNRILIDSISDVWLAPSEAAQQNLVLFEGKPPEHVHFVGNIMIDSLRLMLSRAAQDEVIAEYGLSDGNFGIATFHRPANVDTAERASWILETLKEISGKHLIVFPMHPRTRKTFDTLGVLSKLEALPRVMVLPALRYSRFINLLARSSFILTDSGGVQEEAAYMGKPCFTLRETTERPITVYCGSNHLINEENTRGMVSRVLEGEAGESRIDRIPLWDGLTSQRTSHVIRRWWLKRSALTKEGKNSGG
ncbi:MAG: UDP-N-acetylglucosamine 2-epimerase (non-hydrolyzing) [Xanthobacteraceae bacterium]|nr:UDP-N-acetylglucosamine 2-epimerase (non-hydrolyzing) [Xanthobacteraceae bacterium]